jgi:hypothetical protein
MTLNGAGYMLKCSWMAGLRAVAIIVCAIAAATLMSLSFAPIASAGVCCACVFEESYNYGAEESMTMSPGVFVGGVHYSCGNTAVSSIISSDPNDFTVSYPSNLPGPSCNGFAWNSGNQGENCYFQATFTPNASANNPNGTGAYNSTVTLSVTNGNGASEFQFYGAGFTLSPEIHDNKVGISNQTFDAFPLTLPTPQATASPFFAGLNSITFDSGDAVINFSGLLAYKTSGGVIPKAVPTIAIATFAATATPYVVQFGTIPSGVATPNAIPTPNVTYSIAGGQLGLDTSYTAPSSAPSPVEDDTATNSIQVYLPGIPTSQTSPGIAYQTVTSQLTSLYQTLIVPNSDPLFPISGATTPGLLTQIAMQESGTYQQFGDPPATSGKHAYYPFGIIDSWPVESAVTNDSKARGSHIGLMQVPVTQQDAWNWLLNTADGFAVFQAKVNLAYSLADEEYETYTAQGNPTTLPKLTACQLEEMALELYGPDAEPLESEQYLFPKCIGNWTNLEHNACSGTLQWAINYAKGNSQIAKKERCGVCYVASVRSKMHLGQPPGSTSMCSGTSPLPDPPTGLSCKGC